MIKISNPFISIGQVGMDFYWIVATVANEREKDMTIIGGMCRKIYLPWYKMKMTIIVILISFLFIRGVSGAMKLLSAAGQKPAHAESKSNSNSVSKSESHSQPCNCQLMSNTSASQPPSIPWWSYPPPLLNSPMQAPSIHYHFTSGEFQGSAPRYVQIEASPPPNPPTLIAPIQAILQPSQPMPQVQLIKIEPLPAPIPASSSKEQQQVALLLLPPPAYI